MEKQVIVEQRLQLQQQLNEDIQKLGVQFLTDIMELGQKEAVLNERLSSTSRYSSQLLEDPPVSSSTISPYTHLGAPSAATYEHVPWAWPPSMDQGTLGIDKAPLFETNSPTVREYSTLCHVFIIYYGHSPRPSPCSDSARDLSRTTHSHGRGRKPGPSIRCVSLYRVPSQRTDTTPS